MYICIKILLYICGHFMIISFTFAQQFTWNLQKTQWQYTSSFIYEFKSNHFYCHITTAHVPWWVKFLRACSRRCRNNLHIDSTYLLIQKTMCRIHIHILSTHSVLLDILTVINTRYTPYVHILHHVHIYAHNSMRKCNRLYIILDTQCHGCALDGIQW